MVGNGKAIMPHAKTKRNVDLVS